MIFKDELIKQMKGDHKKIRIVGLLHQKTKLHLSISSLNGKNISLDSPVSEIKIRFQPQYDEEGIWINMPYRLDNSHKEQPIHTHWIGNIKAPATHLSTIKDIFKSILGTEFQVNMFTDFEAEYEKE